MRCIWTERGNDGGPNHCDGDRTTGALKPDRGTRGRRSGVGPTAGRARAHPCVCVYIHDIHVYVEDDIHVHVHLHTYVEDR